MTQPEIVALCCPSCGCGLSEQGGENALDNRYYCEACGTTCILVIESDIAPEPPRDELWLTEAKKLLASGDDAEAIRVVHKANKGMGLYEAKVMVDNLREEK